jgi:hypothetical protein
VKKRGAYRVWDGKPEGKAHLKDPDVDGRIILKRTLKRNRMTRRGQD